VEEGENSRMDEVYSRTYDIASGLPISAYSAKGHSKPGTSFLLGEIYNIIKKVCILVISHASATAHSRFSRYRHSNSAYLTRM